MPRLIDSLFNKTASEAVEALAQAYVVAQTKRASTEKKAIELSNDVKNSLIGAAIGGGAGGLGTLGLNYLKGKDLKLNDALYGAVAGALPGAAAGYYQGDNIASAASDVYKAISGKTKKDTDKGSGAGAAAGSGSGSTAADNVPKPGSDTGSDAAANAVASLPKPEVKPDPAKSTAKENPPSESKTEPMGPPSSLATKRPPHSGNGWDTVAEVTAGTGLGAIGGRAAVGLKDNILNPLTGGVAEKAFWDSKPKAPVTNADKTLEKLINEATLAKQPLDSTGRPIANPTLADYAHQVRLNDLANKNKGWTGSQPLSEAPDRLINKGISLAEANAAQARAKLPNKGLPPAVRPEAFLGLQSKFAPTKQTANKFSNALLYALAMIEGNRRTHGGVAQLATPKEEAPKKP